MRKILLAGVSSFAILAAASGAAEAGGSSTGKVPMTAGWYAEFFGGGALGAFGGVNGQAIDHDYYNNYENGYDRIEHWHTDGHLGNGWLLGAAVGKNLSSHVRGELELSYVHLATKSKAKDSCTNVNNAFFDCENFVNNTHSSGVSESINSWFVMANMWYDIAPGSAFDPYVGGGAGVANVNGKFRSISNSYYENNTFFYLDQSVNSWAPALQVGAGATIQVSPKFAIDLGYRFKTAFDVPVTVKSNFETEANQGDVSGWSASKHMSFGVHIFQVGVRANF